MIMRLRATIEIWEADDSTDIVDIKVIPGRAHLADDGPNGWIAAANEPAFRNALDDFLTRHNRR